MVTGKETEKFARAIDRSILRITTMDRKIESRWKSKP